MKSVFQLKGLTPKRFLTATLLVILAAGLAAQVLASSPHLTLGNPSQATADTSQKDNFLMEKPFFALSYNNSKATPNWVS